jgi:hypothetical protein
VCCELHDLRARLRCQQGNTLLLMPAAVLVMMLLAAITVDAAVLFLGQRRVADLAASVARDAVAYVDQEAFYAGEVRLEESAGRSRATLLASQLPHDDALLSPSCELVTGQRAEGPVAEAVCTARVRFIFTPAVPGAERMSEVRASDTAVGLQGG